MNASRLTSLVAFLCASLAQAASDSTHVDLWSHDNLHAWCVVPFDAKNRGSEERAQMLERLGFKSLAYDWRHKDIPTSDAEIEALQKHGIKLLAWYFPFNAADPTAKATLEAFKRHGVHPQLWVPQLKSPGDPKTAEDWAKLMPEGIVIPTTDEEFNNLSEQGRLEYQKAFWNAFMQVQKRSLTKTPQERRVRVEREAKRIAALAELAAPYGIEVELYNHNGWFGMVDNQVAVISRLKELGVANVGMVYNFSHAHDDLHNDTANFPVVWAKIKDYVKVVNLSGTHMEDGSTPYLSEGDHDLEMMRTVQESGWRGPIGLTAEHGGDAQVTLANNLRALDWLAAELRQPGSGGARPSFSAAK